MSTRLALAAIVVLALLIAGCPRPPQQTAGPPPATPSRDKGATASSPPSEPEEKEVEGPSEEPKAAESESTPFALRTAPEEDHPILKAVLAYMKEHESDVGRFVDVSWISVEKNTAEKPEDLPKDAVIYKVTTEKGKTIVVFGPPFSEYDVKFTMAKSEAGEWTCTGHQVLQGDEDFG
jgi:hypothetical protein